MHWRLAAECEQKYKTRHDKVNEAHKDVGCRGINAFQASGLKSYECVPSTQHH